MEKAALGDWEQIVSHSRADIDEQVGQLTERITTEVARDLEAEGESRSPEQWEGLRWGAEVIAKNALPSP
jgi:hypothetical protein